LDLVAVHPAPPASQIPSFFRDMRLSAQARAYRVSQEGNAIGRVADRPIGFPFCQDLVVAARASAALINIAARMNTLGDTDSGSA